MAKRVGNISFIPFVKFTMEVLAGEHHCAIQGNTLKNIGNAQKRHF